ncbi:MAG: CRTAC1 family protein [Planctomycetales bacterium]|nr:CRTAC1 family protein [Planctomycetales bacterium]
MTNIQKLLVMFVTFCCLMHFVGCGGTQPTAQPTQSPKPSVRIDGHAQMIETLAKIKQRIPQENNFLGNGDLKKLRNQYASQSDLADVERGNLLFEIGTKNVFLGNTMEGIAEQEQAFELLSHMQTPEGTQDRLLFTLGVSYMRQAENRNCIENHTSGSCIFPIQGNGVHQLKQDAKKAIAHFTVVLKSDPNHLPSRWLLNVAYMAIGEYPKSVPEEYLIPPSAFDSEQEFPRFVDRASQLGLDFPGLAGGSVVDDFDDDGFLDIVVSSWGPADQLRYFHNDGDGTFSDVTDASGLTGIYGGLNMTQADYDNDGDLDIFVLRGGWLGTDGFHPNSLLRNDGAGHFRDVTFEVGLGKRALPTQTAAWADYDNDGDLDLYVGNEGYANQLFRNDGNGTFLDIASVAGVADDSFTKGVVWGDFDNDRRPDLYVSNMGSDNRLFQNLGNGTFANTASQLNVVGPKDSFPTWFWDFNNDGIQDLFVASFSQSLTPVAADYLGLSHGTELDCLYQGMSGGRFIEVAEFANLKRVSQPMGSNFGDLDNDGFLDFYLGTGFPDFEGLVPNLMFLNDGGRRFLNVTTAGGFGHLQKGHGVSIADLDNDGDQDIFHELGGWFVGDAYGNSLFENPGFGNHWITIKLVGTESNRCAIGARLRVDLGDRSIWRWVNSGGSFGCNPLRQQIGIGKETRISKLEIYWPTSDTTQVFEDVDADQFIRITEGDDRIEVLPWKTAKFRREANGSSHHHHHGEI